MCALGAQIKNPLGALFNEVPDRITDTLFLILVGILSDALTLSLFASLAAAFTAYVRTLGASLGAGHDFGGPQSKSQRMGLLIGASFLTQGELWLFGSDYTMHAALWIIALGSLLTCWMRLTRLARTLKEQA